MGTYKLSSRAIIGTFFNRLQQNIGTEWVPRIGMEFTSNQPSEEYAWLGMSPAMREWIGGRQAKGLNESSVIIKNKKFEATIEVLVDELRRDKTGQILIRVQEIADRYNAHWAKLLSALIIAGEAATAGLCYDGQYFFDTDHSELSSGTQSNDISVDISALPTGDTTGSHGTTTAPSVGEMSLSISAAIQAILGFKDDQGEPMNENAREFIVMVPSTMFNAAMAACSVPFLPQGMNNPLVAASAYRVLPVANVRLNASWTTEFAVFRTDGLTKPFILQNEYPVQIDAIAEGSELEFKEDKHYYGIKASRNVGFGYWQHGCLVTMT